MDKNLDQPLPGRNYFAVSWCEEGLEGIVDMGAIWHEEERVAKEAVWDILAGNPNKKGPLRNRINEVIGHMTMRARVNSHRNYEIYIVMTEDGITKDDLKSMFDENPQNIVDTIREVGIKIFGEPRPKESKIKII